MNELETSELCAQVMHALRNPINVFTHEALVRLQRALVERIDRDADFLARGWIAPEGDRR